MTSTVNSVRHANYPTDINHPEHGLAKSAAIDDDIYALFKLIQSGDDDAHGKAKKMLENDDLVEAVKGLSTPILGEAAAKGNLGVLSAVLEKMPAEIETPDADGMTPILRAAKEGQTGAVEALIAGHAELSKTDNKGNTSLMWAALSGFLDIVKMLLGSSPQIGPNDPKGINAKNKDGNNAAMLAAAGGHKDTVKLLIDNEVDIHAKNHEGDNSVALAAKGGHKDTIELLIEKKADINAENNEGKTPLTLAAEGGHRYTIELLIENGADINAKDKKGRTPLYYAALGGHSDIVADLVRKDASLRHLSDELQLELLNHDKLTDYRTLLGVLDPGTRKTIREESPPSA